jgi:hypothetical protein
MHYPEFIAAKHRRVIESGISTEDTIGPLYGWQKILTERALRRGRSCLFADCGLGKTIMQLEWAEQIAYQMDARILILAPLAVAAQTEREAIRFGYSARVDESTRIVLSNYEKIERFDPDDFIGLVLDESSILKSHTGHYRTRLIEAFAGHRFKLACSATPAPNDWMELGNHAEFVGVMTRAEMLAMFFYHDGGSTQNWRLKGHAKHEFWQWVATWASLVTSPSDLGFSSDGFDLPPLSYFQHRVESRRPVDALFPDAVSADLHERRAFRKHSIDDRCELTADLVNGNSEPWLVWCDLNAESAALAKLIPDSVEVRGSDTPEHKTASMLGFADGSIRVLVTKPSIAGWGMNWQNCARMVFVGLSDSYEKFYQATRRCWRFGQTREVEAHIVISDGEGAVLANVIRKETDHKEMQERMRTLMDDAQEHEEEERERQVEMGTGWEMIRGDCVEVCEEIETESIDYSVFSPPFASLYTYSNDPADMGNSSNDDEFFAHFKYLAPEMHRITRPGRLLSFHCMLLPTSKTRDGVIGLKDFRGDLIRIFQAAGWIYHSEVCIWKDPVTAMQRTKALGLLHKTIRKDSAMSRQGIPDYVVTMRKPGENTNPIAHDPSEFPVSLWQKWASPIWTDIKPNDTLTFREARDHDDERHICPLQLDVIRRCIGLWTNRGDTVFSPFAGIGSEGYEALKWGRSFIGVELKQSYFDCAVRNLRSAVESNKQGDLFS